MTRSIYFLLIIGLTFGISCNEDEEDMMDAGSGELTSPADLSEGGAEFLLTGDETFTFKNALSTWTNIGNYEVNGRKYAVTYLTLINEAEDVTLEIVFYVHDPEAGFLGGKIPYVGSFEVGLTTDEQSSTDTQGFARISIDGASLKSYYSDDTESTGFVTVTSVENGVIEGSVDVEEIFGFEFPDGFHIDIMATFKSAEES